MSSAGFTQTLSAPTTTIPATEAGERLSLEDFLKSRRQRAYVKVRKLSEDVVHGVKLDQRYRMAKVRYNGKQWIKVWAIHLPARAALPGKNGAAVPERLFVLPCEVFPKGASYPLSQGYFLEFNNQ